MREQVLGLEVVLASGEIWNGLRRLKKDNTGYAMKHLFIGAEGTLGIVTAAALRLVPLPKGREVAWAAVPSPAEALALLNIALDVAGNGITAFELIHRTPLEFVLRNAPGSRDPLPNKHEWQVLVEISSGRSAEDARDLAEAIFAAATERNLVEDAVIAQSIAQRDALWKLRDDMGPAQGPEGLSIKHDVAVPVHRLPEFLERGAKTVSDAAPRARLCAFGHMGDGNIHFNVSQPVGEDGATLSEGPAGRDPRWRAFAGAGAWRIDLGGARHWPAQARSAHRHEKPGRVGDDAGDQAGARPQGHHEPRQGGLSQSLRVRYTE